MTKRRTTAVSVALLVACAASFGCDNSQAKCKSAQDTAHDAVRAVLEGTVVRHREANAARDEATNALTRALMDLGNTRSEAVLAAQGRSNDAAVGVEVAVGAMVAAVLGVNEVADDAEASAALLAKISEAMDGSYRALMTGPHEGEEAGTHLAEVGDTCSTTLQLAVRELPASARARVLDQFQTIEADETAPASDTSFGRVSTAFAAYRAALDAASAAKARNDAVSSALEATRGPPAPAVEAFGAIAADSSPEHAAAATAVAALTEACGE